MKIDSVAEAMHASGLEQAFESGLYHDLIVRCESREWKVHRVILCANSGYFAKACKDTFMVRKSGEINLQEDDPDMVDNMLRFLYTSDYRDDANGDRPLLVNAKMYSLGDKYSIEALKELAEYKFSDALDAGWDIVSFPEVIDAVYNTTPASDRGLRDRLTPVLLEHKEELHEHEGFNSLITGKLADGDFAMDVINAWTEFEKTKKKP
ncbi:hypothetical protein G7Y79_00010g028440 [Physcia stellaris]|nr:hypothetical protein G7Y79_00010g028440 [Physcia stellaris]